MFALRPTPASQIPVSLWAQYLRHSPRYGFGLMALGAYHGAQYWFDRRLMHGVNVAVQGQHALTELMRDRTVLVIAHRLSTIREVDRILVLHRGRLVEAGTHEQLLGAGGLYSKLYRLQFARGAQR